MTSDNYFENPFKGVPLDQQVTNPNIIVGRYSYYSGYYHGHSFDDCARYLSPDLNDVDQLIIGSFCSIGTGVSFVMAGNQGHRMDWISTFPFYYTGAPEFADALDGYQPAGDTVIGHDVWIGAEVMIMPGVTIGSGSVIGSRSVVTKDIEPYSIVTGVPAKIIRKRFSEDEIALLEEMAWWDWSVERLSQAQRILCSNDIQKLYDYWLSWKSC
ncbi:type B chloramphenicol O-acetyltransferase [Fluoribacter gormanii]|uniref:Chloramphenicol acetyltransferase n=1 Tax=Fluoribacter gormanii TaxID=464 RepID=A0A377GJJ3_9GAMM|nr:type B chloramphenicol O-acetyltransferase [Fluoribacter gormanii]KTD00853.1 chloramphenicol acetyltransferase [Fluoribacter gormanii]MCW8443460.1 type B chloramphenicol O-acetyltransferase [Fluoribacter gormanii]MCW8471888.1 type B chloramphenicol O-acetyltransferase [Fluoribacter gormanii]SIQ80168.1 chloramphenicol O-acetyltransferase type B [Fluoribacter gormanii]STO25000.1 Chloramphenicol acetyltransferase [Fluoribacter gormanii]